MHMMVTASERGNKLKAIKYMGLFKEPSEPLSTSYWKKSKRDYSALTATQKARRVDK